MDWRKTIRSLAEEIIYRIEHDRRNMWGYEDNNETNLDFEFPDYAMKEVEIDGVKHKMTIYCILDDKLPNSLSRTF